VRQLLQELLSPQIGYEAQTHFHRRRYAAVQLLPSMNLAQIIPTLATAVAVTAAITDVRDRRIPNRLTYLAMIAGLVLQAAVHGWRGLLQSLAGGLLFGGVFLIFHLVRAMGAGDVKLAVALGCIIGPAGSWQVMFATAVAGGALAILVMVFTGRVLKTLRNTLAVVGFHAVHGLRTHPEVNLDNPTAVRLPYGLAFAAGTLYWAFLMPMWR
jgi:prepilin peptidase CpaA